MDTQLPTPPNEPTLSYPPVSSTSLMHPTTSIPPISSSRWNLRSGNSNRGSSIPSPPDDPPDFDESQSHIPDTLDPLMISSERFDFPDPSNKASPTSSNEAEADPDDLDPNAWANDEPFSIGVQEVSPTGSPDWNGRTSPSSDSLSDTNPFADANAQKRDDLDTKLSHDTTV